MPEVIKAKVAEGYEYTGWTQVSPSGDALFHDIKNGKRKKLAGPQPGCNQVGFYPCFMITEELP